MKNTCASTHADKDRFILRFHSEGQRDMLKARAQANLRTMNAEILFLIEAGIRATKHAEGLAEMPK
ncbi:MULTISPECIES: Arc family DNA-binding protein [Massilia]|uniref:Arc family DNA-binding protein n=1 Tax=Massilia antarctica TaxID=2765360 RepID=A0AA48WJP1_9BURK|nr:MULTISPECIES: Arc family DNA-binding protein [Massilia]NHZ98074.1 Arc family DNA-binding protein [Massilia sp. CCM 8734]QPI52897.1 Arc family DNA-binding protein [Massilia antarctica]